jgi:hypothetical protein
MIIPHMSGLLGGLGGFALAAVIMALIGHLSRPRPPSGDQSKSNLRG